MGRGRQLQGQPHVASAFSTVVQHSTVLTAQRSEAYWSNVGTIRTVHTIAYSTYSIRTYSTVRFHNHLIQLGHNKAQYSTVQYVRTVRTICIQYVIFSQYM